ncbi:hypothetical protein D082_22010 [Synechocystis sp. PCC 6714]|nr:hypothetical protein D082_22010 [Synechocystis sp. PCC 6714]
MFQFHGKTAKGNSVASLPKSTALKSLGPGLKGEKDFLITG